MKTFCGWGGLARPSRLRRSHTAGMQSKVHPTYKTKYRVANWSAHNQAIVRRGDVTVWVSSEAIAAWTPRRSGRRGGQRRYSDLAIETALTLRLLYHLPLRQAEGFLAPATIVPKPPMQYHSSWTSQWGSSIMWLGGRSAC